MENHPKRERRKINIKNTRPTALVAGGAGFIGTHLSEALLAQNFNVIALDNLSVGGTKENTKGLLASRNFSLWEEDINKPGFKLSPTISLTHVFHLASVEEHFSSRELSLQTLLVNSLGTKNLLDLAVERAAKFILVSSAEVFHGALSKTSLRTYFGAPSDPSQVSFAEAKRFAETLTAEYFKNYQLQTTIIRIKDPYGPRMDLGSNSMMNRLIGQALSKNKIELLGDGLETLNPTYVTDIVLGVVKAALQKQSGAIFSFVNEEKYTERSVAEALQKIIPELEIVHKGDAEVDFPGYSLPSDESEQKLNWEPKISLTQGLTETVSFYKNAAESKDEKTRPANDKQKGAPVLEESAGQRKNKWLLKTILLVAAAFIIWVFFVPPLLLAGAVYLGDRNLKQAENSLVAGRPRAADEQAAKAADHFKNGQRTIRNMEWLKIAPGGREATKQTKNYLFFAENIASATQSTAQSLSIIQKIEPTLAGSEKIIDRLAKVNSVLRSAKRNLELAAAVDIDGNKLPVFLPSSYESILSNKQELQSLLSLLEKSLRSDRR